LNHLSHLQSIRVCEEAGSAVLEFALTSTILFMAVFGIIGFSMAVFAHHQVSEAARRGSRYAMVRGNSCTNNGASCTATSAQIQSYVQGLSLPAINSSSLVVTTSYSSYPTGSSCTPNTNCENPGNLVTVQVNYPSSFNVPFVPSTALNMTASSSMVISQ
jgi:Flp pilus assembly protein TadG